MRKTLAGIVTLVVAFVLLPSPIARAQDKQWRTASEDTVQVLRDLVRIDTTNPPGNEKATAVYIQKVLSAAQIDSRVIESAPGRASIIARIKGNGQARAVILMAHMDVVGVEPDKWTFDPFGGELRNGYVLGRGAADDKAMLAANLELMLLLKRSATPLDRDIVFLGAAGEEGTPEFGINYLLEHEPAEIDAEYALNEGGDAPLEGSAIPLYVAISTAEKIPRPMRLTAKGTPGHGAFPSGDNAIAHLAEAVARISEWQVPVRLNETTREFFRKIAALNHGQDSELARTIASDQTQSKLQGVVPRYWAMSRTTVSPTMLNAGFRINAVPADATATLDIRMLPDEDADAFLGKLRNVINDPSISVEPVGVARPVSPTSGIDNAMFRALSHGYKSVFPGITVLPQMVPGATDCAQLRVHGTQCYGVAIPMTAADRAREHGVDERISVIAVEQYLRAVFGAIQALAAQGDSKTLERNTP
jgi:acetylornithine deacetylase/succinyl-diaminopimelate desuccinylase-like protein